MPIKIQLLAEIKVQPFCLSVGTAQGTVKCTAKNQRKVQIKLQLEVG